MRSICKNIFAEYNIPCDEPKKKRKRQNKPRIVKAINRTRTASLLPDDFIDNFSDDENIPTYPYIQLRRSFEIPLKLVFNNSTAKLNCQEKPLGKGTKYAVNTPTAAPPVDDSDDDMMPLPIKEELLTQPSEEFQLSMPCSSIASILSSVPSIAPRVRAKVSSDESSISSGDDDLKENSNRRKTRSMSSIGSLPHSPRRSRKEIMARYRPLDISITKINSTATSPRKKVLRRKRKSNTAAKKRKISPKSQTADKDLNTSWFSSDDTPFQNLSGNKSFVCSSPKRSQIINTPSSTPSPRKRPTELDLMIELIEKENSMKNTSVRKSPRKSSKSCIPGGFVELYQRSLGKAKTDARFLKHDKKFGLRNGLILQVLKVNSSHGVHVAEVRIDKGAAKKKFAIVLPPHMVSQIKSDSKIEAFFDDDSKPYTLESQKGRSMNIFVKPYKLLLL